MRLAWISNRTKFQEIERRYDAAYIVFIGKLLLCPTCERSVVHLGANVSERIERLLSASDIVVLIAWYLYAWGVIRIIGYCRLIRLQSQHLSDYVIGLNSTNTHPR